MESSTKQLNYLGSTSNNFNGKIKRRESEKIYVDIYPGWKCDTTERYSINFELNRTGFQLQHNALKFVKEHRLFNILINNPLYHSQRSILPSIDHSILNETGLNDEQNRAIDCILSGRYNPVPYLLYGPPGKN